MGVICAALLVLGSTAICEVPRSVEPNYRLRHAQQAVESAHQARKALRLAKKEVRSVHAHAIVEESETFDTYAPLCDSACIQCESGGDPGVFSPSGKYWGLYQFDYQTWVSHGGSGAEFGKADAHTQHQVAARVTYDAWPNC